MSPRKIQDFLLNPLSANITKWSSTLKQFVGNLPTNCLSMFDDFVGLVLKGVNFLVRKIFRKRTVSVDFLGIHQFLFSRIQTCI